MKLAEINKIPTNPSGSFILPDNVLKLGQLLGKSEGREVYSAAFNSEGRELYVFFNRDESQIISYVVVHEHSIGGRDTAEIKRSWTLEGLRQKGYISGLLKFIKDFTKMSIMSDVDQTPDAQILWKNLERKFAVKAIDQKTGEIIERPTDAVLYKNDSTLRLFIESASPKKHIQEWTEPLLPHYFYFEDGDA